MRIRIIASLAVAAAMLLASAPAASAAPTVPTATLQPTSLVILAQDGGARLLDAHEIASYDYRVVTRPRQTFDSTQLWRLQDWGGAFYTLQQVSSGRYLDAYYTSAQDFRAITRPWTGANSQVWRIVGA